MLVTITEKILLSTGIYLFPQTQYEAESLGLLYNGSFNEKGHYQITIDGIDHVIAGDKCVETDIVIAIENQNPFKKYETDLTDVVTDYITEVKKGRDIDMRVNYAPQYADNIETLNQEIDIINARNQEVKDSYEKSKI